MPAPWRSCPGLLARHPFVGLLTPYEEAPSLRMLMGAVATQPLIDALLAAGFAWAAHSSGVAVLLAMSFAAKGVNTHVAAASAYPASRLRANFSRAA